MTAIFGPTAFVEHPAMLGWLAAAAAPLVIHLLNRRKFREMSWGAMQFLLAAVRKNSRRVRIEQWLLLLLRTLLIAAAVTAVAHPGFRTGGSMAPSYERVHRILVIDGSFSMDYKPTGDVAYFQQAKDAARRIIDAGREGDAYGIVLLSSPSRAVAAAPLLQREEAATLIAGLAQPHGAGDLTSCLNEIDRVMATARETLPQIRRREVHFLTDLGRRTWAPGEGERPSELPAEFHRRCLRWGGETTVAVVDLGTPDAENTAVVELSTDEPFALVGLPTTVRAVVQHFGRNPRPGVTATLRLDGKKVEEKTLDLEPAGRATVVFSSAGLDVPRSPGRRTYEVELASDRSAVDDRRYLVLDVKPHLRVLLVRDASVSSETEYGLENLETALRLKPGVDRIADSPVSVETTAETDLSSHDLDQYDVAAAVDVRRFSEASRRRLHEFVRAGGGLITFLGAHVDVEHYNTHLADGEMRLLPARIGPIVDAAQYRLNPLNYEHPMLGEFRGRNRAGIFNTPIYRHYRLDPSGRPAARRVLEFMNDEKDPLLVEESIGAGRSLLAAVTCDASWTALPLSPGFVPLVQEMTAFAVGGRSSQTSAIVGAPLDGKFRRTTATAQVTVRRPADAATPQHDEAAEVAPQGENYRWSYAATATSGIYKVQVSGPPPRTELFAVNVDVEESDPVRLAPSRLTDHDWSSLRFVYGTEVRDFSESASAVAPLVIDDAWHHRLLWFVLAAALGETWWAGRIDRRRG